MSWHDANPHTDLNLQPATSYTFIQWHHGTDSRTDSLPDGGWEIETAKYPNLQPGHPFKLGQVLHGQGRTIEAWHAETIQIAALATVTRWYFGSTADPTPVPSYEPGAWSKLHVLAYVPALQDTAVLTLRSTASRDLGRQLRAYNIGLLTVARQKIASMPPCGFWLPIGPGETYLAGNANQSRVTPPVVDLPGNLPASPSKAAIATWAGQLDPNDVSAWLNSNFVGQDHLDLFASMLPDIEAFRTRYTEPNPEPAGSLGHELNERIEQEKNGREPLAENEDNPDLVAFFKRAAEMDYIMPHAAVILAANANDPRKAMAYLDIEAKERKRKAGKERLQEEQQDIPPAPPPTTGDQVAHLVRMASAAGLQDSNYINRVIEAASTSGNPAAVQAAQKSIQAVIDQRQNERRR